MLRRASLRKNVDDLLRIRWEDLKFACTCLSRRWSWVEIAYFIIPKIALEAAELLCFLWSFIAKGCKGKYLQLSSHSRQPGELVRGKKIFVWVVGPSWLIYRGLEGGSIYKETTKSGLSLWRHLENTMSALVLIKTLWCKNLKRRLICCASISGWFIPGQLQ